MLNSLLTPEFLSSILRATTPILLAALAALVAQQSGIVNMAVEGIMLFAALFAAIGAGLTGNVWIGLVCGISISVILSLVLAYFKMSMNADEILIAIAINMLATGATIFLLFLFTGDRSTSSKLGLNALPTINIPFIQDIPVIGQVLSGQNILTYVAFLAVIVINIVLYKTSLGLRIRAVGGNPDAAISTGVSVEKTRYLALIISGVLAGLAGSYMSMGYMSMFTKNMVAGRGFIALAAANVGGMHPIGTMFASLLFGVCSALANSLQSTGIPVEFINMIPYAVTIIAYAFFSYRLLTKKKRNKKKASKKLEQGA